MLSPTTISCPIMLLMTTSLEIAQFRQRLRSAHKFQTLGSSAQPSATGSSRRFSYAVGGSDRRQVWIGWAMLAYNVKMLAIRAR